MFMENSDSMAASFSLLARETIALCLMPHIVKLFNFHGFPDLPKDPS